jgi:hypothetical protein
LDAWRTLFGWAKAALLVGAGSQVAQAQQDAASRAWEAARAANTVEAYENFLESYPDAPAADDAFSALVDRLLAQSGRAPVRGLAIDIY